MTIKDVDYEKTEIKDAYTKTACHMPKRHNKKKREKKKKKKEKDAYPKKVCHMPTRHVKKKKDSPHSRKIKKRDGSCKGVHPPSAKKKSTHLHILIKLYDSFLLGSSL